MATIIKATDPRTNVTDRVLKPLRTVLTAEVEEPATLEMFFENDWDLIYDETNENNPLALGSKVVVTRDGTTIFKGFVHRRDLVEGNGEKFIHVLCLDKLAKVRDTVVHDSGEYTFARTTPSTSFSQITFETSISYVYDGSITHTALPITTNTSCYLPTLSYLITGVNTGTKTFTVDGDATNECYAGIIIEIYGSTGNDGFYTVVSSSYTSPGATTDIVVSETIPSATVDGNLQSEFRTNWDTNEIALINHTRIGDNWAITGVNQSPDNYFTIAGNKASYFEFCDSIWVDGSTGNDDNYTIDSVVESGGNTLIYVVQSIPSGTVDGRLGTSRLTLGSNYKALLPEGYLIIDDEVIFYSGYVSDSTGKWAVFRIWRGDLNTTKTTHSASSEIRQLVPLKIHPAEAILVEGYTSDSPQEWVTINTDKYTINVEEGSITFNDWVDFLPVDADIGLDDPRIGYDSIRVSYSAFDELSSSAVRLDNIAEIAFGASKANGGAGLASNEYNIDLPSIRLTRVLVSEPIHTLDLLDTIEAELNFQGDGDLDVISTFYDSQNDLVNYKTIAQKTTADRIYTTVYDIQRDFSLDEIYSGIVVKYVERTRKNLIQRRTTNWQPEIGDTLGSNSVAVDAVLYQIKDEVSGFGWNEYTSYPVGFTDQQKSTYVNWYMRDIRNYTGWGLGFSSNPGSGVIPLYSWFDDDGGSYNIDRIKAVLDVRRESDSTNPINIKIVGFTGLVPPVYSGGAETSPINPGSEIDVNGALQVRFAANEDTDSISEYVLEATDIGLDLNAIGVKFDGVPRTRDGYYRCMIKELTVNGSQNKALFVRLINNSLQTIDLGDYAADTSYEKLIDDEFGNYKIKIIDVGTATTRAAASLGRLALLESLALSQQRVYKVKPDEGIPVLGETVQMADSFEGVVISTEYVMEDGLEELNLRIIDLESELV